MKVTILLLALGVSVLSWSSCNRRNSLFETPSAPASPGALPAVRADTRSLEFQPPAALGTSTVRGKVTLAAVVPERGIEVSLTSGDPTLLSLPSSVVVPAGSDSIEFLAMTQAGLADRDVTAMATVAVDRSATATVSVWAVLPTFFSFWSETGDWVGQGGVVRLTPPFERLWAECVDSSVQFSFRKGGKLWGADFAAPKGTPLRVGTYEGATRWPFQTDSVPGFNISGDARGCNALTGRFIVREVDFTASGQVRQFWATFEQHCEGGTPALYGDVRVTSGPPPSYNHNCLR
jgi:hypothetical protein